MFEGVNERRKLQVYFFGWQCALFNCEAVYSQVYERRACFRATENVVCEVQRIMRTSAVFGGARLRFLAKGERRVRDGEARTLRHDAAYSRVD